MSYGYFATSEFSVYFFFSSVGSSIVFGIWIWILSGNFAFGYFLRSVFFRCFIDPFYDLRLNFVYFSHERSQISVMRVFFFFSFS